jgi:hypothetical protein
MYWDGDIWRVGKRRARAGLGACLLAAVLSLGYAATRPAAAEERGPIRETAFATNAAVRVLGVEGVPRHWKLHDKLARALKERGVEVTPRGARYTLRGRAVADAPQAEPGAAIRLYWTLVDTGGRQVGDVVQVAAIPAKMWQAGGAGVDRLAEGAAESLRPLIPVTKPRIVAKPKIIRTKARSRKIVAARGDELAEHHAVEAAQRLARGGTQQATRQPVKRVAEKSGARPATAYWVQLAANRTKKQSEDTWAALSQAHTSMLAGERHAINRVDLGKKKGVYYRLQLGPYDGFSAAGKVCGRLRSAHIACFVIAGPVPAPETPVAATPRPTEPPQPASTGETAEMKKPQGIVPPPAGFPFQRSTKIPGILD